MPLHKLVSFMQNLKKWFFAYLCENSEMNSCDFTVLKPRLSACNHNDKPLILTETVQLFILAGFVSIVVRSNKWFWSDNGEEVSGSAWPLLLTSSNKKADVHHEDSQLFHATSYKKLHKCQRFANLLPKDPNIYYLYAIYRKLQNS